MPLPRPRLILSALKGGAGKTTVSLALAAALRSRGLKAAPFKKGPDYIDTAWLELAAGRTCRNLDPFLMGWDKTLALFAAHTGPDSLAVIEGNRGLYDGLDAAGSISTAELAKRLAAPVVLIVDCTKATRTIAALVLGCQKFDPQVNLGGVILNHLGGARHERMIRECLRDYTGLPVLGALPRQGREMPERHMGLVPTREHPGAEAAVEFHRTLAEEHLDLAALEALARSAPELEPPAAALFPKATPGPKVRIGIVRDAAFQFYYPENLEALEAAGAELVFISALADPALPPLEGLYIGGGFPETQARALADNASFRESLKAAGLAGLPIYAECGGLMFLGQSLTMAGETFPMAGLLPIRVEVKKRPQGHGYAQVRVERANPFYAPGTVLRGHEFHYSRVMEASGAEDWLAFKVERGTGVAGGRDGIALHRTLAAYTHVHALGSPEWAAGLVRAARESLARA